MRKFAVAAFAALIALVTPATAADKGGPPATLEQIIAATPKALSGCYAEAGLQGTFLAQGDRLANGALGFGCDAKIGLGIIGGGFRAFFGESEGRGGSLYGKLGFALNPHVGLYGLIDWRIKDWKARDLGQLALGAGLETTLFRDGVSAFIEASTPIAKWGTGVTKDDVITMVGLRYRF